MELQSKRNCDNFSGMKVALAQMTPHLGDIDKNLEQNRNQIVKAKDDVVELRIFPALSLTG